MPTHATHTGMAIFLPYHKATWKQWSRITKEVVKGALPKVGPVYEYAKAKNINTPDYVSVLLNDVLAVH